MPAVTRPPPSPPRPLSSQELERAAAMKEARSAASSTKPQAQAPSEDALARGLRLRREQRAMRVMANDLASLSSMYTPRKVPARQRSRLILFCFVLCWLDQCVAVPVSDVSRGAVVHVSCIILHPTTSGPGF